MGKKAQVNQQRLHDDLHNFAHQAGMEEINAYCIEHPESVSKILQWLRTGLVAKVSTEPGPKRFSRSYCKLADLGKGHFMKMMCEWEAALQRRQLEQIAKTNLSHILNLFCFCVNAPPCEKLWSKVVDDFEDHAAARYLVYGSRLGSLPGLLRQVSGPASEIPWAQLGFYSLVVDDTSSTYSKVAHVSGIEAQLPGNMTYEVGQWTIRSNWAEAGAVMVCTDAAMKGVSINIPDLFTTADRDRFGKVCEKEMQQKFNAIQKKRRTPPAQADPSDPASAGDLAATVGDEHEYKTPPTKKAHVKESGPTPDAVIAPPAGNGGRVQGSGLKQT
jgi:hypothetical protein